MVQSFISPLAVQIAQSVAEGKTWEQAREETAQLTGIVPSRQPSDQEIASALRSHYAVYDPQGHALRLRELRETALTVMKKLEAFRPRLIRGVLNGCADEYSDIHLQVISEDVKAFELFLLDDGIDFSVLPNERRGRMEFAEQVVFEAPLKKGGFFDRHRITPWVYIKVYENPGAMKNIKTSDPDSWQIKEEAAGSADIQDLENLLILSKSTDI